MTAHPDPTRAAEAGYTLLELMAVLAVLAFTAAIVMPRLSGGGERVALRASTMEIAAGLRAARVKAMGSSRETAFIVDLAAKRYWAEGAVKARSIPKNMTVVAGHRQGAAVSTQRATVRFQPDGSASGGWIGLRSKTQAAEITVDWLTGSTRIEWSR